MERCELRGASRAIFCLLVTRRERCLGWSWHWCGAGEALGSRWGHLFWKCTQGKTLLIKSIGWKAELGMWQRSDWLVMYSKLDGCGVDKQCSKQSYYVSFSHLLPFEIRCLQFWPTSVLIIWNTVHAQSKYHLFECYWGKGEEAMLDCWLSSQSNHRWSGGARSLLQLCGGRSSRKQWTGTVLEDEGREGGV